VGKERVIPCHW